MPDLFPVSYTHLDVYKRQVFSFDINTGYPAVMNDAALVDQVRKLDPNIVLLEKPEMISEDFAHYQRKVPGVFFFLGTCQCRGIDPNAKRS